MTDGVHSDLNPIAQGIPLDQDGITMDVGPTSITAIYLIFAEKCCASLRNTLAAAQVCDDTVFESEDTVVLKPKEHDLLEIRFRRLEKALELVLLWQFNNLKDLARVLDWVEHG